MALSDYLWSFTAVVRVLCLLCNAARLLQLRHGFKVESMATTWLLGAGVVVSLTSLSHTELTEVTNGKLSHIMTFPNLALTYKTHNGTPSGLRPYRMFCLCVFMCMFYCVVLKLDRISLKVNWIITGTYNWNIFISEVDHLSTRSNPKENDDLGPLCLISPSFSSLFWLYRPQCHYSLFCYASSTANKQQTGSKELGTDPKSDIHFIYLKKPCMLVF